MRARLCIVVFMLALWLRRSECVHNRVEGGWSWLRYFFSGAAFGISSQFVHKVLQAFGIVAAYLGEIDSHTHSGMGGAHHSAGVNLHS